MPSWHSRHGDSSSYLKLSRAFFHLPACTRRTEVALRLWVVLQVVLKQVRACKCVWAEVALVRSLARVAHHVPLEDAVAAKPTLADWAVVRPVAIVQPFVAQLVSAAGKAAAADATLERPLTRVSAPVACEVGAEVEALGAQVALMPTLTRVPEKVLHESLLECECFAAEFTLIGLANPVDHLVGTQLVDARERAATFLALERSLGSAPVHLDVHCQPLGCREDPLAAGTGVLFLTTARRVIALLLLQFLHEQTCEGELLYVTTTFDTEVALEVLHRELLVTQMMKSAVQVMWAASFLCELFILKKLCMLQSFMKISNITFFWVGQLFPSIPLLQASIARKISFQCTGQQTKRWRMQ